MGLRLASTIKEAGEISEPVLTNSYLLNKMLCVTEGDVGNLFFVKNMCFTK